MLLSSGTLVSKCCAAVIYDEGDGFRCMKCLLLCESDGTLGDLHEKENQRSALESTLARTFVRMQRERAPQERQRLWAECIRLASELEKLG